MNEHKFTNAADVREYVIAGNATVTLESLKTNTHFTYKVKQATDKATGEKVSRWFVGLLTGPDNELNYSYLGLLDARNGGVEFRLTAGSKAGPGWPSVMAFEWMWKHVNADSLPDSLVIRHNGHCGRCGRTLTVPESIDRGIGPECASKMRM